MSKIVINLDDGKDDTLEISDLDKVASSVDTTTLDGGHLILMTTDRGIAVDSAIKFKAAKPADKDEGAETEPKKKAAKRAVKKKSSKGSKK